MFMYFKKSQAKNTAESGFVLVLALVVLLLVSLTGIWALRTSTSELQMAGGSQQVDQQFNITEGGAYSEAGKVGFVLKTFYAVADPANTFQILSPQNNTDFDPGNDHTPSLVYSSLDKDVLDTWPLENMLGNYNNTPDNTDEFDYRYLTTYLHEDTPPMGYDGSLFAAYKFRLQSGAATRPLIVELGGAKIGPK